MSRMRFLEENAEILLDETVVIALRAIGTVLVIYSFGILLTGFFRKIDQVGVNALSSLVASLFIPCFYISRLGKAFTFDLIAELWMLPLVYMLIVLLNAIITYVLLLPISRCNVAQRVWFALGQFFANVLALPLLVIPSVCSQIEFKTELLTGDTNSTVTLTEAECVERGEVFLILSTLLSQFAYWLLVFPFVFHFGTKVVPRKSRTDSASTQLELRRTVSAPAQCGVVDTTEDNALLMDAAGVDPERGRDSARNQRQIEVVEAASKIPASASAWARCKGYILEKWRSHHVYEILRTTVLKGAVCSQIVGCVIGLWPDLRYAFFDASGVLQPIGAAVTATASGFAPVVNLALSATLGMQSREISLKQLQNTRDELGVHRQTYIFFVLGRMVLLPVLNFLFFYLLQDAVLPKDRLLRFALYAIIATPAANLHIVVANILEDYTGARFLAKGSFLQFCTGIISYTLFLFLAVVLSAL